MQLSYKSTWGSYNVLVICNQMLPQGLSQESHTWRTTA